MKINLRATFNMPLNGPTMPFDVLCLPLPCLPGKSLVRVIAGGAIRYQVAEQFESLAQALAMPEQEAEPIRFDPNTIYNRRHVLKMAGQRFAQRIRPCAFANGQWTGTGIIEFLTEAGKKNAATKKTIDTATSIPDMVMNPAMKRKTDGIFENRKAWPNFDSKAGKR